VFVCFEIKPVVTLNRPFIITFISRFIYRAVINNGLRFMKHTVILLYKLDFNTAH